MRKRLLTGAVCLSLAGMIMLTACSGKESAKKGNVELEILLADDTLEGGAMKAVVEKFNEEHKDQGVSAFVNEIAYADMETQIKNRAKAGNLPAICKMSNFDTYIDYVLPLDDTSLDPDNFNRSGVRNGKLYGTDVNDTAVGMVINKTAFDEAGVSYPTTSEERWTWDEFSAAVKEVAEKNEKITTPFVIDHSQQRSGTVLYQFGMKYFDPDDSTKVTFRSEDTKKGVEFFLDMFKEGGISKASIGTGAENAQDVFKTGTVAAHMAGNWVISDYTQNIKDFEWTPVLMPYEKEKATCLGGNWLYAFDGSGMEDQAKKFLEWFYQPENYSLYCQTGNYLPGTKDVEVDYEIEGINIFNMEIAESIKQPQYDQSITEQEHSGENTGNALRDALDRAIAGELDADGVMDYVVTQFLENLTGVHE
ncbi:alpha-1,4-digalacturonate transport system substrate-binding protein [Hungatella effluvii]|uniref:Alpha-1,4-digalacturonate transport system substrate-binding protein n=1 Tax=Hungatella effluvii TaxID=1096246 RepID=A0A2V3YFD6_9FIRM|nr:extracellular solute-binding protein [Hungatella effluvii]PXX56997.1 alpha-1,4-digalacturonate transport system substrate-binding protein [Hungatella effluvii]